MHDIMIILHSHIYDRCEENEKKKDYLNLIYVNICALFSFLNNQVMTRVCVWNLTCFLMCEYSTVVHISKLMKLLFAHRFIHTHDVVLQSLIIAKEENRCCQMHEFPIGFIIIIVFIRHMRQKSNFLILLKQFSPLFCW